MWDLVPALRGLPTAGLFIVRHGLMWYNDSMKLSDWARRKGIAYQTAWKWWRAGKLPVPARQMPSGTILVEAEGRKEAGAVLYARVSSAGQKADLDRQVARLAVSCGARRVEQRSTGIGTRR
jgi:predicted site-specific integrase-resolvase